MSSKKGGRKDPWSTIRWARACAPRLSPTEAHVLLVLASYADDREFCFPSKETLAEDCARSSDAVYRALGQLRSRQLVKVVKGCHGEDGHPLEWRQIRADRRPNLYQLQTETAPDDLAPTRPRKRTEVASAPPREHVTGPRGHRSRDRVGTDHGTAPTRPELPEEEPEEHAATAAAPDPVDLETRRRVRSYEAEARKLAGVRLREQIRREVIRDLELDAHLDVPAELGPDPDPRSVVAGWRGRLQAYGSNLALAVADEDRMREDALVEARRVLADAGRNARCEEELLEELAAAGVDGWRSERSRLGFDEGRPS